MMGWACKSLYAATLFITFLQIIKIYYRGRVITHQISLSKLLSSYKRGEYHFEKKNPITNSTIQVILTEAREFLVSKFTVVNLLSYVSIFSYSEADLL